MKKENLGHLMVDIETLGTKPGSVICSIAAVEFNIHTGEVGRTFNEKISLSSTLDFGLKIDAKTIEWWMCQSSEAREKMFGSKETGTGFYLTVVLNLFTTFIELIESDDLQIWGNSARFDLGLLEHAFNVCGIPVPWIHCNERDVRTLVSFAPEIKKNTSFEGVKHDALADCLHQIQYCTKIFKKLHHGGN